MGKLTEPIGGLIRPIGCVPLGFKAGVVATSGKKQCFEYYEVRDVQIARDIVGKLTERALIPLYYGLGVSGAIASMLSELYALFRERVLS